MLNKVLKSASTHTRTSHTAKRLSKGVNDTLVSIPKPVRAVLGFGLLLAGIFGALLPMLGLWMIPVGLIILAVDYPMAAKANRFLLARAKEVIRLLKKRFWR